MAVKALRDEKELSCVTTPGSPPSGASSANAAEGRVGYAHVPNMMSLGWAEVQRDLRLAGGGQVRLPAFP